MVACINNLFGKVDRDDAGDIGVVAGDSRR